MKCKFLIASQFTLIDHQSKRASCINVLEDIRSPNFPLGTSASIITFFEHLENVAVSNTFFLNITLNESLVIPTITLNINIPKEAKSVKNLTNIGMIVIPTPGVLKICLSDSAGNELKEFSINIESESNTSF